MSKGGGRTQKVDNAPWRGAQGPLLDIFSRAGTLSQQPGLAPQSPITAEAQKLISHRARTGSSLTDTANQGLLSTMRGESLNPYTTGALGDVMDMAKSKINSQFSGDNFGNSAHQEWLGRGLMSASMPFAQQAHEAERGRQMQAFGMAPGLAANDYTDLGMLGQVGAQQDARAQMQADDPWTQLQRYQGLVSGGAGGASTQSQNLHSNPMAGVLGGGLAGAGLGSMMAAPGATGLAAVGGWPFLLGGAALGLLGS